MDKKEKLQNLLEEHERIIGTHEGANYYYITRKCDMTKASYRVNAHDLTTETAEYLIGRLEQNNYPFNN